MKVRLLACAVALLAAFGAIASKASAKAKPKSHAKPVVHYYVALGDSLSVGYQPIASGAKAGQGVETAEGYVNDIYAAARKHIKNLKLEQFGCPGDTTASMLTGKGNAASVKQFHCDVRHGSQLQAAEAFLKAHHAGGSVPLITIDIGANDVDGCGSVPLAQVSSCISTGVGTIKQNLPKILAALRKSAPKGARLAGMNLYDPLLADELSSDPNQQGLGTLSTGILQQDVNPVIAAADQANGFKTADVADAFKTYDTTQVPTAGTPLAATGNSTVPNDVAQICALTWMCAPAPVGPNIHANQLGYATIATAFEAVLPKQF